MKIEIFGSTNSEDLERMVNEFCMDWIRCIYADFRQNVKS